jgi:hypothetical protein
MSQKQILQPFDLGFLSIAPSEPEATGNKVETLAIMVGLNTDKQFPKQLAVGINGKAVNLSHSQDGMYVASINPADYDLPTAEQLGSTGSVGGGFVPGRLVSLARKGKGSGGVQVECEVEGVPCPPDCKSLIFRTPCVVCFKVKCKFTLGGAKAKDTLAQ